MRVIKKYPNRRLYDTEASKYITLEDVRKLVLSGIELRVVEVKSEEDITRNILLQIIAEQEHDGAPIFSVAMLTQIIRLYGNAYQAAFSAYLQKSLELFTAQQQSFQRNFHQAVSHHAVSENFAKLTEQNMELWRQAQDSFLKAAGLAGDGEQQDDEKP